MGVNSFYESVIGEYLPLYKREGILIKDIDLRNLICKSASEAESNYLQLKGIKTCSKDIYIQMWVRKVVDRDFATRSVNSGSLSRHPASLKASINYFSLLPYEQHKILSDRLFDARIEDRKEIWLSFALPIKILQLRFKRMSRERFNLAIAKGYPSFMSMCLDKFKIPQSKFDEFTENINKTISFCNKQLTKHFDQHELPEWFYSEFNEPCFVCRMPDFPLRCLGDVWNSMRKKQKLLKKFQGKIDIDLGDTSKMTYVNGTDSFAISVEKTANNRHQVLDLLHELSHVSDYLHQFENGFDPLRRGIYEREKEAALIELKQLEQTSPSLRYSFYNRVLLLMRTTIFEIALYKNPHQNLSRLYANSSNACFTEGKQKSNPLYILDANIVLRPMSSLPYAVAYSELLWD